MTDPIDNNDSRNVKTGDVFEYNYPFVRYAHDDTAMSLNDDLDRKVFVCRWKPGVENRYVSPVGDTQIYCDGMGKCRLEVFGVFKPERFPTRVFFTRQWQQPDSDEWHGLKKCRITTLGRFNQIREGYKPYGHLEKIHIEDLGAKAVISEAMKAGK